MSNDIACVVAGAGVVGLAIGRSLAVRGMRVAVVERAAVPGTGISGRNSEVIHAGLYYPVDSLKTRLCMQGNELLYDYSTGDRRIRRRPAPDRRPTGGSFKQIPDPGTALNR